MRWLVSGDDALCRARASPLVDRKCACVCVCGLRLVEHFTWRLALGRERRRLLDSQVRAGHFRSSILPKGGQVS